MLSKYSKANITLFAFLVTASVVTTSYASAAAKETAREPAAIALLEKADKAIREIDTMAFKAHFDGLWWARGRVEGDVKIRRSKEVDPVLQQIYYDVVAEINAIQVPAGSKDLPSQYKFVMIGKDAWVIDDNNRHVIYASGFDRVGMLNGATSVILPQFYRPDPMSVEIEQSTEARLVGQDRVEGVLCDVMYLKFPDEAGFGEQYLYFGVDDHILRKATLVTRDEPGVTPAGMMQTVMRDVTVNEGFQNKQFKAPKTAGYSVEKFASKDVEVGSMTPDWSIELYGGGSVSTADLRGEAAVLVFWASWCPTCHAFFPEVVEMAEKYRDANVRFIAINVWDTDDPKHFVDEHQPPFEIGLEGNHVSEAYRFIGQPAVIVLDEHGIVRHKQMGARPADEGNPRIWAALDTALAES